MRELWKIVIGSVLICKCLILGSIVAYYTYIYSGYLLTPAISNRFGRLVVVINIGAIVTVGVSYPIQMLSLMGDSSFNAICGHIHARLSPIAMFTTITANNLRFWLMYYNIRWTQQRESQKWITLIDDKCSDSDNWILKYKSSLGNYRFMCRIGLIIYILTIFLYELSYSFDDTLKRLLQSTIHLLATAYFVIIRCVTPAYNDKIRSRDEMKLMIKIGLMGLVVYIIVQIAVILNHVSDFIQIVVNTSVLPLVWTLAYLVTTYWVLRWSGVIDMAQIQSHFKSIPHPGDSRIELRTTTHSSINNQWLAKSFGCRPDCLERVITHPIGFERLMAFLFTEFSVENLLCVVETVQWRQMVIDNTAVSVDAEQNRQYSIPTLPPNIHKSSIIADESLNANAKMILLIGKYISNRSEFQVNISSEMRSSLDEKLTLEETATYDTFDPLIDSLMGLMTDSMSRFKREPEFLKLATQILDDEKEKT